MFSGFFSQLQERTLPLKLRRALEAHQQHQLDRDQLREAVLREMVAVESSAERSPQSEIGERLIQALEVYYAALEQLARLVDSDQELDETAMTPIYDLARQADDQLQALENETESG